MGSVLPFPTLFSLLTEGIWILHVLNHSLMKSSRNKQNPLEVQHRPTFHMVAGGLLVSYSPGSSQDLSATAVLRAGFLLGQCLESILSHSGQSGIVKWFVLYCLNCELSASLKILFHYYYWGEKAMKCFGLSIRSHLCVFVCSKEGDGQWIDLQDMLWGVKSCL